MLFAIRRRALASAGLFYLLTAVAAFAAVPTITGFHFLYAPTTARNYDFDVNLSAPVIVSGSPTLNVRIGGVDRAANLVASSTAYPYIIVQVRPLPGDNGPLTVPGPFNLNGGTIQGTDGTNADLSFTPVDNTGITIDTTPPAAPVVSGLDPASPGYQQAFVFSGTAEPSSTITFTQPDGTWGASGPTDVNGNWKVYFTARPAGTYTYNVTAADHAGNKSSPTSASVTVSNQQTTTPPRILDIQPPGNGLYGGYAGTNHITLHVIVGFDRQVVVTGSPSITVQIGSVIAAFTNGWADGSSVIFNLDLPNNAQYDGTLKITGPINLNGGSIKSTDGTDATLSFTPVDVPGAYFDTTPPPNPAATGVTPSPPTADQSFTVNGTAEAGDTVQIQLQSTYTNVPVDSTGHWSATFGPLPAGTYTLGLNAVDKAGNWAYWPGVGGSPTYYTVTVQPASSTPPPPPPPPPTPTQQTQTITFVSPVSAIRVGQPVTLGATSSAGLPITYSVVSGDATINGNVLTPTSTADLIVRATSAGNDQYAAASTDVNFGNPQPVPISRLVNISSRVHVSANDSAGASIAGFVVSGTSAKQFLIRGVGPTLARYGVGNPLATPQLRLFGSGSTQIAANAGWGDDAQIAAAATAVNAFALEPGSKDAALLVTLDPGTYTAQVASTGSGTALIEVYDVTAASATTKQLINISTRGSVGSGDDVLIGGFVIAGDQPKKVLIRGVGPTLGSMVPNSLHDPVLTLYDSNQAVVAVNDNWGTQQPPASGMSLGTASDITAAETATGAFPLENGSADAALLISLPPGSYTAIVTGANGSSGNALVEVYEVP